MAADPRAAAGKKEEEEDPLLADPVPNGRGRGVIGTMLLPGRYNSVSSKGLADANMWVIAATPLNISQFGPFQPEEPRHRVLMTQTSPPILLLELNAQATFNMMDPDLAGDVLYSMDACKELYRMPKSIHGPPRSYVIQGSGPHFCPGGNPSFKVADGHTALTMAQYTGYLGFVMGRELALPGVAALHGSMVGGGVAYSLNCTARIGTHNLSVSYGNLSRGAVPGMMLSRNVVEQLGLAAAVELYLTDGTLSSYAALKGRFLSEVVQGNALMKAEGVAYARRIAAGSFSMRLPNLFPDLDVNRYAIEAIGINLSARSGVLFSNVKGARKAAPKAEEEAPPQEEPIQEDPWARRKRPPRKPPRRRPQR